jgi:hypothetical protein
MHSFFEMVRSKSLHVSQSLPRWPHCDERSLQRQGAIGIGSRHAATHTQQRPQCVGAGVSTSVGSSVGANVGSSVSSASVGSGVGATVGAAVSACGGGQPMHQL